MPQLPAPFVSAMRKRFDSMAFVDDPETLRVYECDALAHFKQVPLAVFLPLSTQDVVDIVKCCNSYKVPFTPRGAGTGLSGGALADKRGILIDTSRMKRILELNTSDRFARVEPGLVNLRLSDACQHDGLFYAPDPSSQMACTLGGNIAENSGGPHCLKYGATTNHVLGVTVVLEDGEVLKLGDPNGPTRAGSLDLLGAFVGSEGTLGIVTEAYLRLTPKPPVIATLLASFDDLMSACKAVSGIIAAGVPCSAIEAIDRLTIQAVEASVFAAGYPLDAEAVILVELDGEASDTAFDRQRVESLFEAEGCLSLAYAEDPITRKKLWQGRKGAFGAMGRIAPDLYVMDCVVPRSKLAEAIEGIAAICKRHNLRLANVFHAGEGNLHPNISYDGRDNEEVARVHAANEEIVAHCLDLGGTLSGEHGIGVEKIQFMTKLFGQDVMDVFEGFRHCFAPKGLANPGKILPTPRACTEAKGSMAKLTNRVLGVTSDD